MTDIIVAVAPAVVIAALLGAGFVLGRLTARTTISTVCTRTHVQESHLLMEARTVVAHIQAQFPTTSGEYRRAQALRVMLNRNPEARERDAALAIELAVRE